MIPETAVPWVLGLVVSMGMSAMAFLGKRAFTSLEESISRLGAKLDAIQTSENTQNTALALLQHEVANLRAETNLNRERFHTLANEVAAVRVQLAVLQDGGR